MSNKFKITLEENSNIANEGLKGALIGLILAGPVGAVIGHFWQEYLIKKEKEKEELEEQMNSFKANLEKAGNKQKYELVKFKYEKVKDEIKEIKIKVKQEESDNKKISESKDKTKVAKEELEEPSEITEKELDSQIETKTEEVVREEELVEGLEALKFIASKIGTPSATEVALFRVCANMAVAGTKQEAQKFLPAMEAKKQIDTKGFDEKIKEVQKKIALLNLELGRLKAQKKIG